MNTGKIISAAIILVALLVSVIRFKKYRAFGDWWNGEVIVVAIVAALACGIFLTGCATMGAPKTVLLEFDSSPKGAKIYYDGKLVGNAPVILPFTVTEQRRQDGFIKTQPMSARWISGAEKKTTGITVPLRGGVQRWLFQRPDIASGEAVDEQRGLELEKLSAMQQQAEYQRRQSALMYIQTMQRNNSNNPFIY